MKNWSSATIRADHYLIKTTVAPFWYVVNTIDVIKTLPLCFYDDLPLDQWWGWWIRIIINYIWTNWKWIIITVTIIYYFWVIRPNLPSAFGISKWKKESTLESSSETAATSGKESRDVGVGVWQIQKELAFFMPIILGFPFFCFIPMLCFRGLNPILRRRI